MPEARALRSPDHVRLASRRIEPRPVDKAAKTTWNPDAFEPMILEDSSPLRHTLGHRGPFSKPRLIVLVLASVLDWSLSQSQDPLLHEQAAKTRQGRRSTEQAGNVEPAVGKMAGLRDVGGA